jgi:hypothetical protein
MHRTRRSIILAERFEWIIVFLLQLDKHLSESDSKLKRLIDVVRLLNEKIIRDETDAENETVDEYGAPVFHINPPAACSAR